MLNARIVNTGTSPGRCMSDIMKGLSRYRLGRDSHLVNKGVLCCLWLSAEDCLAYLVR